MVIKYWWLNTGDFKLVIIKIMVITIMVIIQDFHNYHDIIIMTYIPNSSCYWEFPKAKAYSQIVAISSWWALEIAQICAKFRKCPNSQWSRITKCLQITVILEISLMWTTWWLVNYLKKEYFYLSVHQILLQTLNTSWNKKLF